MSAPLTVHVTQLTGGRSSWSAQVALEAPLELAGTRVTLFYQGQAQASERLDEWGHLTLNLERLSPPLDVSAQVSFEVRALNPMLSARSQLFHPPIVVEVLQAHLEAYRTWPRHLPLRGAQLDNIYLPQADLRGVDLRGASLAGATLKGAQLEGVILKDANLESVDFTGADLTSANLEGAKVHNATLEDTILNGADFRGVRGLKASDLTRAADLIIMDERQMKALSILQERERQALSSEAPSDESPQKPASASLSAHDRHYAGHTKTHTAQLHEGYLSRVTPSPRLEPEGNSDMESPPQRSAHLPPEVASEAERARVDERERRRAEQLARYQQTHQLRGEVSFQLNLIPEGSFVMGTERPDREESASPRVEVKINKPFFLLTTPVTQALYLKVMDEARFKFPHPEHPAENVSWYDALEFCNRLSKLEGLEPAYQISLKGVQWSRNANGYRLPTEAEWEHAARAQNTHLYAGGGEVESLAWCALNASGSTHPVAQKAPNAWGLYDMSGNVWEWCYDLFKEGLYQKRASASLERPCEDPVEEGHDGPRIIRGGSWSLEPQGVEVSHRSRLAPHFKTSRIGFRVARSPHMR